MSAPLTVPTEGLPVGAHTLWPSLTARTGQRASLPWPTFFDSLRRPVTVASKKMLRGWSPATSAGDRRMKAGCEQVTALVLDYDKGTPLDTVAGLFPFYGLLHTTYSHTVASPRCRVILPYARPVTTEEHGRIYAWALAKAAAAGVALDSSCSDPLRLWFMPGVAPGGTYEVRDLDGPVFDPDAVLRELDELALPTAVCEPAATQLVRALPSPRPTAHGDIIGRARKYLAGMPAAVSGKGGHAACFAAALAMVRGFDLPDDDALALLRNDYNPRCQPPWSDAELEHKVADAEASQGDRGYLADAPPDRARERRKPLWADAPDDTSPPVARPDAGDPDADDANEPEFDDDGEIVLTGTDGKRGATAPNDPFAWAENEQTDVGRARCLTRAHGADIRYVPERGWYAWNGAHWAPKATAEVTRRAMRTVGAIVRAAKGNPALEKFAKKSQEKERISAMVTLAQAFPGVGASIAAFDVDPWALNCLNGTLALRTGELRPHRRDDMLSRMVPVAYDPAATCPLFDAFMAEVQPDPEVRAFLQRYIGYAATGVIREHVFPIHWGKGRNGKGVFTDTILTTLGDYAAQIPTELLMTPKTGADPHPTGRATLLGRRFAAATETEEGRSLNIALVKQLTGGDAISARYMRQDFFVFQPTHKLWLATNNKPVIRETSDAAWDRVLLVPWTVYIPAEKRDLRLKEKLLGELPGILAWIVRGCLAWQTDGLQPPAAVTAATGAFRGAMDRIGEFIAERCFVEKNDALKRHVRAHSGELYRAYAAWSESRGERPMSNNAFAERMENDRGLVRGRPVHGARHYEGVRLLAADENPVGDPAGEAGEAGDTCVGYRSYARAHVRGVIGEKPHPLHPLHPAASATSPPIPVAHPSAPVETEDDPSVGVRWTT